MPDTVAPPITTARELVDHGAWGNAETLEWARMVAFKIDLESQVWRQKALDAGNHPAVKVLLEERDAANAACNEVLNSLEWSGDGFEWNPPHGDYREQPLEALRRGQKVYIKQLTDLQQAVENLADLYRQVRKIHRHNHLLPTDEVRVRYDANTEAAIATAKGQRTDAVSNKPE